MPFGLSNSPELVQLLVVLGQFFWTVLVKEEVCESLDYNGHSSVIGGH